MSTGHNRIEMGQENTLGAGLNVNEAADRLHVSRARIFTLIRQGQLPIRTVGFGLRIALNDLQRFDELDRPRRRAALDELSRTDHDLGL